MLEQLLIGDAIEEINRISQRADLPFLETLELIKANPQNYSLTQLSAFYKVMAEGRKMFAPIDNS